jgi:hypothetical protein
MKKYFFAVAVIALFAFACSTDDPAQENADSLAACKPKPLNPNGDSELAILMREMADWMDSCKVAVAANRNPPGVPESFKALMTAKRTDPNIDESTYQSMAHLFETKASNFDTYFDGDPYTFNEVVDACVSCHKVFCQGPLVRINKMYIQ